MSLLASNAQVMFLLLIDFFFPFPFLSFPFLSTEGGVTPLGYSVFFEGPYNPYNPDYYCGGSSGGSAVAVATGLLPMAVGWDGGGSIRMPASMSGVLGLATTFGRIPNERTASSTNIKGGPLASTMNDIALSYLLLGQIQPESFYTDLFGKAYLPPPHLTGFVPSINDHNDNTAAFGDGDKGNKKPPLHGVRLGVFWDHFQHTDREIYDKSLQVVQYLVSEGATVVNFTIPYLREIHLSHGFKILTEFGIRWETQFYNQSYILEPNTEITIKIGRSITADEILAAEKIRNFAVQYVRTKLFDGLKLDAIVSPMLGAKVPKMPSNIRGYGETNTALSYKLMRYAVLANFLGLPGISIPIGYEDETGLPIGFQLLGDAWSEPALIRLGCIVENYLNIHGDGRRKPPDKNFFDVLGPWLKS
jgi:Asp-tRNA(Asn)/Glu-tRNA(Gln) amidotransferase A subunit family amidase